MVLSNLLVRTILPQVHKYFLESPKIGTEAVPNAEKQRINRLSSSKKNFSKRAKVYMTTPSRTADSNAD